MTILDDDEFALRDALKSAGIGALIVAAAIGFACVAPRVVMALFFLSIAFLVFWMAGEMARDIWRRR